MPVGVKPKARMGAPVLPPFVGGTLDGYTAPAESQRGGGVGSTNGRSGGGGYKLSKDVVKATVLGQLRSYYAHIFDTKVSSAGTSWQMRCPFHDDKSPSLSVSKEHGGFACQTGGCGEKGDIFKAWMKIRGVDFGTALRQIAEWAGDPAAFPRRTLKEAEYKGGTVEIKDRKTLSQLASAQKTIMRNEQALNHLRDHYGITKESIVRFKLGFDTTSRRLWIPIYHRGKLCGIRKHDILRAHCVWTVGERPTKDLPDGGPDFRLTTDKPTSEEIEEEGWKAYWGSDLCRSAKKYGGRSRRTGGKVIGVRGHNSLTLYPSATLGAKKIDLDEVRPSDDGWLCLTGGELKAIFLNQNSIPSVAFTAGEGKFTVEWLRKFTGMDIDVCMDADEAGVVAADKLSKEVAKYARQVRVVHLPHGDANDYYRDKGWVFDDWWDLPRTVVKDSSKRESVTIPFSGIREAENVGKEVQFRSIVAGSGDTPWFVPSRMKAVCKKGAAERIPACEKCKLASVGFEMETIVPAEDLIEIRSKGPKRQIKYLTEVIAGVPDRCPHPEIKTESTRIAEIGLVKDVDTVSDWTEDDAGNWFVQKVYYVDKGEIPENEPVQCFGKIIADPNDSRATMVLRRMEKVRRAYESGKVTAKTHAFLNSLPGADQNDAEDMANRLGWFAEEFEERICHIYEQRTLLLGSLLLWFMPLRFTLFGKPNEKINAEVLLVGDTRAGKTSSGRAMLRHFRAGRFVQCEGATFAGLVGGSGEQGNKKFFTWGVLPSQDGGFVLMDEIDDIVRSGVFGQLTSIRSDGMATRVIAGGMRQARARLRMLMASNPLGNRRMRSYSSTMYAINELLKTPQDVARYEYAIGVYRPDDPAIYNRMPSNLPPEYTSQMAAEHVRWAWRQKPSIDGAVAERVMEVATELNEKYKELVLLTASEARWKVARIAAGIAALCFSEKNGNVVVTPAHASLAGTFLEMIYGSHEFAYDKFMKNEKVDSEKLRKFIKRLGSAGLNYMYDNDSFNTDMIDTLVDGISNRREFMRVMTMEHKCLKKSRSGYVKTQGFKDLLDELRREA